MKPLYILFLLITLAAGLCGCAKEYGKYPVTTVALQVDLTDLNLPAGTMVTYRNIELTMNDVNRSLEINRFTFNTITDEVVAKSSLYNDIVLRVDVLYQQNGSQVVRPTQTIIEYEGGRNNNVYGQQVVMRFKLKDKK